MRWTDRLYVARDNLLSSPRFQEWAAAFPLTRGIARRRANATFDLTAGFVYAQILAACVRLGVLETLRAGPHTAEGLAPKLDLTPRATTTLLEGAAALGLVATRNADASGQTRYGLGMDGAALLGNPGALAMIAHHERFYADLADPVALLRGEHTTALSAFWPYAKQRARDEDADVGAYTQLMSASQPLVAADILRAYDFGRHRHLLDLGGGDGTFLSTVLARVPRLTGTVFDLPQVVVRAQSRFASKNISRANATGGDLWNDALPEGADVISLVRVLHDHDDSRVAPLLAKIFAVLPVGGTLVIAEPMATGAQTRRMAHAYFGFYLSAMGSGRARSPDAYITACGVAGFASATVMRTRRPLLCSVVVARKK